MTQAAYTFMYRFMANKSAEYPEGILDKATLKSFNAIEGTDEKPIWNRGHERIPDNWYKRNKNDEYSVPYFLADVLYFAETQPEILEIGCNQGRVNSFNKYDFDTLASGRNIAEKLAKNPVCVASQFAKAEIPMLTGIKPIDTAFAPLVRILDAVVKEFDCESIGEVNSTALVACPGFSFYGGPTAKVAHGAIQS